MDEFLETVRTGTNPHHKHHEPQAPLKHGAPKLGRNDPCSCGSGKKYKKCHGK
ncbi:MAG: preprotein translocase subunit SecA [Gammaproteobacteria bacterium]|nr:MAG: preprotein translocase subunit SecA [Gammaproteobacteria bacterium]